MLLNFKSKLLILTLLLAPVFLGSSSSNAGLWERLSSAIASDRTRTALTVGAIGAAAAVIYGAYRLHQARAITPPELAAEPAVVAQAAPLIATNPVLVAPTPVDLTAAPAATVATAPTARQATKTLLISTGSIRRQGYRPNLDYVNRLIRAGADLTAARSNNRTALWFACYVFPRDYQPALVELLIRKGADINVIGERSNLFQLAQLYANGHLIRLLLQAGATVLPDPDTNELVLATQAELALIPPLIAALSPITPAQTAAMPERLATLIASGANVNATDAQGVTPLMALVENSEHPNTLALIDQLIAAGANINAQDHNGLTALHHVFKRQSNISVPLYETHGNGAVEPVYEEQRQPDGTRLQVHKCEMVLGLQRDWDLMYNIVDRLIQHGANIHLTNSDGYTPFLYALEQCCSHNPAEHLPASIRGRLIAAGALAKPTDADGVAESKGD